MSEDTREWQSKIQLSKPFFYIEAENQISLKQEIVIEGDLLADQEKPKIRFAQNKTYASSIDLEIEKVPRDVLKALKKGDTVTQTAGSAIWTIKKLKQNQLSSRQIEVKRPEGKHPFVGSYEILRGQPWEANLFARANESANSLTPGKVLHSGASLGIKYFFSDFLFLKSAHWNHLKWAIFSELVSEQYFEGEKKHQETIGSFDLIYKFQSGLQTIDPAIAIGLGYQVRSTDLMKRSGLALSFNYFNPTANLGFFGEKIGARLKFQPAITDDKKVIQSGSAGELSFESRYKFNGANLEWSWSLMGQSERLLLSGADVPITNSTLGFSLGINKVF
jgi:hypothetical protein